MSPTLKVALPLLKGLIMAFILLVGADLPFLKALAVAICSAVVSGAFLLIATSLQLGRAEQIHRELKDVKKAIGAHRREEDDGTA